MSDSTRASERRSLPEASGPVRARAPFPLLPPRPTARDDSSLFSPPPPSHRPQSPSRNATKRSSSCASPTAPTWSCPSTSVRALSGPLPALSANLSINKLELHLKTYRFIPSPPCIRRLRVQRADQRDQQEPLGARRGGGGRQLGFICRVVIHGQERAIDVPGT